MATEVTAIPTEYFFGVSKKKWRKFSSRINLTAFKPNFNCLHAK